MQSAGALCGRPLTVARNVQPFGDLRAPASASSAACTPAAAAHLRAGCLPARSRRAGPLRAGRRPVACRAASSSSQLPSRGLPQQEQQQEQLAPWLPWLATAGLCAAVLGLTARPAHAAVAYSSSSQPLGTLPSHAASAGASASYAAAAAAGQQPAWQHAEAAAAQQQQPKGWGDTGILLASNGDDKVRGCPLAVFPASLGVPRDTRQWPLFPHCTREMHVQPL